MSILNWQWHSINLFSITKKTCRWTLEYRWKSTQHINDLLVTKSLNYILIFTSNDVIHWNFKYIAHYMIFDISLRELPQHMKFVNIWSYEVERIQIESNDYQYHSRRFSFDSKKYVKLSKRKLIFCRLIKRYLDVIFFVLPWCYHLLKISFYENMIGVNCKNC